MFRLNAKYAAEDKPPKMPGYKLSDLLTKDARRETVKNEIYDMMLIMQFCQDNPAYNPDKIYKKMDISHFYGLFLASKAVNFKERPLK